MMPWAILRLSLYSENQDTSYRAEINPQPRESRSGQKLVIASQ